MGIVDKILKLIPSQTVYAHCDYPCGIYTPEPMQTAAKTVLTMIQKINSLPIQQDRDITSQADFVRAVQIKEEHAQICKEQLLILWTDYFKPVNLEKFPDLHTTFWNAAKLCSTNKQHVDLDAAKKLVTAVNEIADMFNTTEAAKPK